MKKPFLNWRRSGRHRGTRSLTAAAFIFCGRVCFHRAAAILIGGIGSFPGVAFSFRRRRAGQCKPDKFPITIIAKQVETGDQHRPPSGRAIAQSYSFASAARTFLTDHSAEFPMIKTKCRGRIPLTRSILFANYLFLTRSLFLSTFARLPPYRRIPWKGKTAHRSNSRSLLRSAL